MDNRTYLECLTDFLSKVVFDSVLTVFVLIVYFHTFDPLKPLISDSFPEMEEIKQVEKRLLEQLRRIP